MRRSGRQTFRDFIMLHRLGAILLLQPHNIFVENLGMIADEKGEIYIWNTKNFERVSRILGI